jgi:uncharacterized delta-60 repeat protein
MLGGTNHSRIGRLNIDGRPDDTFNAAGEDGVYNLIVQADGKVLVGGAFTNLGGQARRFVGRLNADGSLDSGFNPVVLTNGPFAGPIPFAYCLALQPDGKIIVGGFFKTLSSPVHTNIIRLNLDGSLDSNFQGSADNAVRCVTLQPDGKILVGGNFGFLGDQARSRIGRFHTDGSVDLGFNPNANFRVDCMVVQSDHKILAAGTFFVMGGQSHSRIARLNPDGSLDENFNAGVETNRMDIGGTFVTSLGLDTDGKILLGGYFMSVNGLPRRNLARLQADGTLDLTFDPSTDNSGLFTSIPVDAFAVQTDGKILVGGVFTNIASQARRNLARLTAGGDARQALAINANGTTAIWNRSGSAPEVEQVTFEQSVDSTNYALLGLGARTNGGWHIAGLTLLAGQNFYLRARGRATSGIQNGSSGLIESVALFYRLPPPFLASVQVLGGGAFQFSFTNTNATAFTVLASSDVSLPSTNWTALGSPVSLGGGLYQFTDPGATNHARRFYQLRSP